MFQATPVKTLDVSRMQDTPDVFLRQPTELGTAEKHQMSEAKASEGTVSLEAYTKVIKLLERQNIEILRLKQEKLDMTVNMESKEESTRQILVQILEGMNKKTTPSEEDKADEKVKSDSGSNAASSENESALKFQKQLQKQMLHN